MRTQIIATLGPAAESEARLKALFLAGVDIVRCNLSHGSAAEHSRRIQRVRRVARQLHKRIEILVDLPGPKYRMGELPKGFLVLRQGSRVRLAAVGASHGARFLPLRQPELLERIRPRQAIFVSDGLVELRVERVKSGVATCRVMAGGPIRSGAGVNLPHTDLGVKLPTAADREWIRFAARHKADWVAVSFVQTAEDVCCVRETARKYHYRPKLMAKIEKRGGLDRLDAIAKVSDGLMVARGDLGVETPLEEVPFEQKRIIGVAHRRRKFAVTATQMLESMVTRPAPTRAEVSDIAHAVLDGTHAVMLSAETAIGQFPVAAVTILDRILRAAERHSKH